MLRGMGIRQFILVPLVGALLGTAPSIASASATIGSSLEFNGAGSSQGGCNPLCTFIPTGVAGSGPVTAPIDGVVVRWGASAADFLDPMMGPTTSTVRLRIVHSAAANQWAGFATGPTEHTVTGFQNSFFPVNPGMRINAGDYIGVDTTRDGDASGSTIRGAPGSSTVIFTTTLPDGGAPQARVPTANIEAFVQATIEPDADHDFFGDESQDQCPASAGKQAGCPPAAAAPPVQRKKCKKKRKKHAHAAKKKRCRKKHKHR